MAINSHTLSSQAQLQGFHSPNTTPVPDELFDKLLPILSGAELKVLLYIIRRTFGFKKQSDNISLAQMLDGIRTKDGRILDGGVGLTKKTLLKAIGTLQKRKLIITERRRSLEKGNEPTTYKLNIIVDHDPANEADEEQPTPSSSPLGGKSTPPLGEKVHQGVGVKIPPSPRGKNSPIQQTVLQETVKQKTGGVVVNAALENFGVSKKVAEQLAKAYPEEYLLEKLELVEWLVNTKSFLVSKNPAGYLRQAIEDDYKPPRKYKSRTQLAREEEESQRRDAADQQARLAAEEEYKLAREAARQRLLEQHPPHPVEDTDLTTETAWGKTLASLKTQVPASTYATWLKDTLLLKLEQDTAFVLVNSRFAGEWLERRLYQLITRTLEQVVGQPMELEFVTSQPAMDPT